MYKVDVMTGTHVLKMLVLAGNVNDAVETIMKCDDMLKEDILQCFDMDRQKLFEYVSNVYQSMINMVLDVNYQHNTKYGLEG